MLPVAVETQEHLDTLVRRINREFRGEGGIVVTQTDDYVIISLAGQGGARQAPPAMPTFPVQIRRDGGNDGSQTTACTITYSVYPIGATGSTPPLATGITPEQGRTPVGRYIQAPDDSIGLGFYKANGTIGIMAAWREAPFAEQCQ